MFLCITLFLGGKFLPPSFPFPGSQFIVRLPLITPSSLFSNPAPHYADISAIISSHKKDSVVVPIKKDSLGKTIIRHPVTEVVRAIEYPDSSRIALKAFFSALAEIKNDDKSVHILHFGDSQLEGDRISDYLRTSFQKEFGGSGPGMLPIAEDGYRLSVRMSISSNWKRFDLIHSHNREHVKRAYGPYAACFSFGKEGKDSSIAMDATASAWIRVGKHGKNLDPTAEIKRCRLFLRNVHSPVKIELADGNGVIRNDSIPVSQIFKIADFDLPEKIHDLKISFGPGASPEFYALELDSPGGIGVDNIPLRGNAGLNFTEMDREILSGMINNLNVKLIILQFGVNVVPTEAENYKYYENRLYPQLMFLKGLSPDLSILVIGASDASKKNGDVYESFKNIDKLIEAQRNAAFKAGCAFWDLYDAMGGANSMPGWVFANPPLGSPDFIHFNYNGARIVGKMLYNSMVSDLNQYLQKNQ